MKTLLFISILLFPAFAFAVATPVTPGTVTTTNCPGNQPNCFVPASATNPLPVTISR